VLGTLAALALTRDGGFRRRLLFSGALHSAAKEPDAAAALTRFLTAPAAAATLRKHGLEPAN